MGMVTQRTQLSTVASPHYTTFLLSCHSWPCTPVLRSVLENRFGDNKRPAPHLDSLSCPVTNPGWRWPVLGLGTPFPLDSLALLPASHKVPLPIGPEVLGLRPPHSGLPMGQGAGCSEVRRAQEQRSFFSLLISHPGLQQRQLLRKP